MSAARSSGRTSLVASTRFDPSRDAVDGGGRELSRQWATTRDIAKARGLGMHRARKLLERMNAAGLVAHAVLGDGTHVWRLNAATVRQLPGQEGRR